MISERHMSAGSWSLKLLDGVPLQLLRDIAPDSDTAYRPWFGTLIVTPAWVPLDSVSEADLLGIAVYSGVCVGDSRRRTLLRGFGLAYLLGTSDGLSDCYETFPTWTTGAKDVEDHVKDHVLRNAGSEMNGVTAGSIKTGGSTKTIEVEAGQSPLGYLSQVVDQFDPLAWRINPDGTLDVDTPTTLFRSDDVALINTEGGRDGHVSGFSAVFDIARDGEEHTTRVVADESGGSSGAATPSGGATPYYGLDGNLLERERIISNSGATSVANATAIAQRIADQFYVDGDRTEVTASLPDVFDPRSEIEPGDTVYCYDRAQDLLDSSNSLQYRGEIILPVSLNVTDITYPVRSGMGVYFRTAETTATLHDLTPFVEWETGPARVGLGRPPRGVNILTKDGTGRSY